MSPCKGEPAASGRAEHEGSQALSLNGSGYRGHYAALGLVPNCRIEEIKKEYRRLSRLLHPDKPGGDTARFQKLNIAHETLVSPKSRKEYDESCMLLEGWECKTSTEGPLYYVIGVSHAQFENPRDTGFVVYPTCECHDCTLSRMGSA